MVSIGIDFTTTGLIANAQRRSSMPNSQSLYLPADFIAFMTDEMHSYVVPLIKSKNDEYFVVNVDVALSDNTSEYTIPTRAQGGSLRDIVLVNSAGIELELPKINPDSVKFATVTQFGIYLRDDKVVFYPSITTAPSGVSLRFKYERMPNDLVLVSNAGYITSINAGALQITLSGVPSDWSTSTTVDIIRQQPLFTSIKDDQVITGIGGNVLTLDAMPSGIAVGQWVAQSRTSPIAQLAYEAHKLIAQRGAIKLCEALEATTAMKNAAAIYEQMAEKFLGTITPRVQTGPKKIVNRTGLFSRRASWNQLLNVRP